MPGSAVVPQLLTMDQLAERLGVTRRHVRRLITERRVPFVRVGRFIRFDPAEISAWLESCPGHGLTAVVRLAVRRPVMAAGGAYVGQATTVERRLSAASIRSASSR